MKHRITSNATLFAGLAIATFTLFASWFIQQPNPLIHMEEMASFMVSGALSGVTVVAATLVGLGLVSRHQP